MSLDLWSYYRVHISSEQQGDNCFEKLKSKLSPIAFLMVLSYLTLIHLSFELCNYQVIDFMFRFLISKNCKFYIKFNSSGASTHSVAIAHIHVGLIIASTLEFLVTLSLVYNKMHWIRNWYVQLAFCIQAVLALNFLFYYTKHREDILWSVFTYSRESTVHSDRIYLK